MVIITHDYFIFVETEHGPEDLDIWDDSGKILEPIMSLIQKWGLAKTDHQTTVFKVDATRISELRGEPEAVRAIFDEWVGIVRASLDAAIDGKDFP